MTVSRSPAVPASALGRPPVIQIKAADGPATLNLRELATNWELLYFLVWRDIKVRYKQTAIGAGWAILQPLTTMVIFTAVFGRLASIPSDGLPYPVFAFAGLLPWTYFAAALSRSGNSLVSNGNLITKVYFPRLLIPLSAVLSPLVDFIITLGLVALMMMWYGVVPAVAILTLPAFVLLAAASALALSLWLSALCVRYRDVGVVIPFLVQIGMYVSPVAYPTSLVPERWRFLYSVNPMAVVIDGFRWALLGTAPPDLFGSAVSCALVAVIFYGGLLYFNRVERVFADVV